MIDPRTNELRLFVARSRHKNLVGLNAVLEKWELWIFYQR
jgi:hypothetical protein